MKAGFFATFCWSKIKVKEQKNEGFIGVWYAAGGD